MSDSFEDFAPIEPLPEGDRPAPEAGGAYDQAGIDALFGDFDAALPPSTGLRALIESKVISHERLPMLDIVYDRVVRSFGTSMRNLTSEPIDVILEGVTSVRFSEFTSRIALPAMIGVFHVEEWDNFGLVTLEPSLIYAVVDALLGGGSGGAPTMIDGRAFTAIEAGLVSRMLALALSDFSQALEPITPATIKLERVESNPRFAAIAGPSNICSVATFRVDIDGRGGRFNILLPYSALEPIRDKLLQRFMGEKLGRDTAWEDHIARELRRTEVEVCAVLGEIEMPLWQIKALAVGQTLRLPIGIDEPLTLTSGNVPLARGQIGQRAQRVAVRLLTHIVPAQRSLP